MAAPPFETGGVNVMVAEAIPADAATPVGAPGAAAAGVEVVVLEPPPPQDATTNTTGMTRLVERKRMRCTMIAVC